MKEMRSVSTGRLFKIGPIFEIVTVETKRALSENRRPALSAYKQNIKHYFLYLMEQRILWILIANGIFCLNKLFGSD